VPFSLLAAFGLKNNFETFARVIARIKKHAPEAVKRTLKTQNPSPTPLFEGQDWGFWQIFTTF